MAEVESFNHGGISAPDVREAEEFYEKILGAERCNWLGLSDAKGRGGNPRPCNILGGHLFVIFRHANRPEPEGPRGIDGLRHAYTVPRERFDDMVERLQQNGVPFEGPVTHPERGPLGQSVYFTDPGGNFMEVCWRRDVVYRFDDPYANA